MPGLQISTSRWDGVLVHDQRCNAADAEPEIEHVSLKTREVKCGIFQQAHEHSCGTSTI